MELVGASRKRAYGHLARGFLDFPGNRGCFGFSLVTVVGSGQFVRADIIA